ncbi:MAG: hypothetical protein LQ350_006689 [Teloschistes chrysophthalmus]|nr:MAG: hypothetical protein LQ350_006689 [Niorma chrysophthalma]
MDSCALSPTHFEKENSHKPSSQSTPPFPSDRSSSVADSRATLDTKTSSKRASAFDIPDPKRAKSDDSTNKHPQSNPDDQKTSPAKELILNCAWARNMSERLDSLEEQLDSMNKRIDWMNEEIKSMNGLLGSMKAQNRSMNRRLDAMDEWKDVFEGSKRTRKIRT